MDARRNSLIGMAALVTLGFSGPVCARDTGWEGKVTKLVIAKYTYPRSAELRHEEGRAVVKIVISGSGKPLSIELVESSGSQILDREAVRLPAKVGTFPTPPGGANTTITLPIRWQLG